MPKPFNKDSSIEELSSISHVSKKRETKANRVEGTKKAKQAKKDPSSKEAAKKDETKEDAFYNKYHLASSKEIKMLYSNDTFCEKMKLKNASFIPRGDEHDMIATVGELNALVAKKPSEKRRSIVMANQEKVMYWDIWLVGEHFSWLGEQEYINRKRTYRYKWEHLLLNFYFPEKDEMHEVHISSCLEFFKKPQQANITSWIREALELD